MTPLLDRLGAFFLDPPHQGEAPSSAEPAPPPDDRSGPLGLAPAAERPVARGFAPPVAPASASTERVDPDPDGAPASPAFAVVLGAPGAAVPVAAACAGELRARARSAAAVLCVWNGGEPPTGATTPAVRRLATRLDAAGLAASACGRLAWVTLDPEPDAARAEVQRALGVALTGCPVVLGVAGPRPAAFEPFLDEVDHAIAVLPSEAGDALRMLALSTLPPRAALVLPPLPPGPPRWAAMAGLARLRALKGRKS